MKGTWSPVFNRWSRHFKIRDYDKFDSKRPGRSSAIYLMLIWWWGIGDKLTTRWYSRFEVNWMLRNSQWMDGWSRFDSCWQCPYWKEKQKNVPTDFSFGNPFHRERDIQLPTPSKSKFFAAYWFISRIYVDFLNWNITSWLTARAHSSKYSSICTYILTPPPL